MRAPARHEHVYTPGKDWKLLFTSAFDERLCDSENAPAHLVFC